MARIMDIPCGITDNKLAFRIPNNSYLWTNMSIIATLGFPALAGYGMSYVARALYGRARKRSSNLKLFLVWLSLHFNVLFWGNWITGLITQSGFVIFLNWIYAPLWMQIVIPVGGLVLLNRQFQYTLYAMVQTAPGRAYVVKPLQKNYKKAVALKPYFFGSLFLMLTGIPAYSFVEFIFLPLYLLNLLGILQYIDEEEVKLVKHSQIFKPDYLLLIPVIIIPIILNLL